MCAYLRTPLRCEERVVLVDIGWNKGILTAMSLEHLFWVLILQPLWMVPIVGRVITPYWKGSNGGIMPLI